MPSLLQIAGIGWPLISSTSASRSLRKICSAVCRYFAILPSQILPKAYIHFGTIQRAPVSAGSGAGSVRECIIGLDLA